MEVVEALLIKTANPATLTLIPPCGKGRLAWVPKKDNSIFSLSYVLKFNLLPGDAVHGYGFFSPAN